MRRSAAWSLVSIGFSLLLSALALSGPARAQGAEGTALITAVDTAAFPDMRVYVSVNDAASSHLADLPANAFTLTENGQPVAGLTASEQAVGVQVVFALDPNAAFKARDANAVTRLDFLKQALTDFAQTTPWMKDGLDDVTVLVPEGTLVAHSMTGGEVAQAVMSYNTAFQGAADPFPLLNQALDFASDATARPGMRRYVVFISNGLAAASLNDLTARATAAQIPVYTVFVGPVGAESTTGARSLRQLAESTGAAVVLFDNPAALTPLFQHLVDQRTQYLLSYRSTLAATGQYTLAAQVSLPGSSVLSSNEAVFPLRVEPPVVTLSGLPATIQRVLPEPGADPQVAEPTAYAVPIKVDFPDGHPRGLRAAELVVDGQPMGAQTITATVAALIWPLADYAEDGPHGLQARVTDELGLTAASEVMTVALETRPAAVTSKPEGRHDLALPVLGLLLTVGLLTAGWLWFIRRGRAPRPKALAAAPLPRLPETQPHMPAAKTRPNPRVPMSPLRLSKRAASPQPFGQAYLEVLEPGGGGAPRADIEIPGSLVHLGRDAALAEIIFPDHSVSRLHARIVEVSEGMFHIFDEGSTSGTWVNFTQVSRDAGWELKPGDVINLGRVQLRFKRREAPAPSPASETPVAKPAASPPPPANKPESDQGPTDPHRPIKE